MKKSLLAVAAIGAFASAAQAQSSVTVYGLLDYGFQGSSQTQSGPAATSAAGTNVTTKTQTSGLGGSGESTSRLGFKGNEDLGGGMSAFFTIEAALNTDSSGTFTSSTTTGNRQSFVGLAKKGLGAASIGLQYTPIHEAVAATNAGGTNNAMGDVIYDRKGGINATDYTASGMSTNDSYSVRTSNALVLKSEDMAGFKAKVLFATAGRDTTQTASNSTATTGGGQLSNTGYGVGLDYTWKKLFVTANYQSFKQEQANATGVVGSIAGAGASTNAFAVGYNGGSVLSGVNAQDNQQYYAATYDFGILKAYAGYINRKVTSVLDSSQYVSRTAQQLGVRAPITPAIQVWASAGTGKINPSGALGTNANINGWQVGSDYNLSKRTNLYAIYGQSATSNSKNGAYAGSAASTANTSWNQSSYAVGVRHTF
jgi:predicted porin